MMIGFTVSSFRLTFLLSLCFAVRADLILTAVFDGPLSGGTPKGVELYVLNDIPDLSIYGLGSANNGGGSDGEEFSFPDVSKSAGDFIYVSSESDGFFNFFGFMPDYTDSAMNINGDDAIELFKDGSVIDLHGDINTDGTGESWDHLDGWAYRKSGTSANPSFQFGDWEYSGVNALDGETTNAAATTPVPIKTYSPGSGPVTTNPPPPVTTEPAPLSLLISQVQGNGDETPFEGQKVKIQAIVVGDLQDNFGTDGDLKGFFLQEEDADADNDAATSEGIFVFEGSNPSVDLKIGDLVEVVGVATEFSGETQISADSVTILSSDNVLPTPAYIRLNEALGLTSDGQLPNLEPYEGMRVIMVDDLVLTEGFNLDRFGEVLLFAGSRPYQYTQLYRPSNTDTQSFDDYQKYLTQRSIFYDDGFSIQNRYIAEDPAFQGFENFNTNNAPRFGDVIQNLSGVLKFAFDEYRVLATSVDDNSFLTTNPRPESPPAVGGTLKVASVNLLNFFVTIDDGSSTTGPNLNLPPSFSNNNQPRGADSQEELDRQLEKLVTYLTELDADIIAIAEIENNFPSSLQGLVSALPSGLYDFVDPGTQFVDVSDIISVAFIYKPQVVEPIGNPAILTDDQVDPSLNAFKPIFDGPSTSRAALAVTFQTVEEGECISVAANHFKSKGGSGSGGDENIDNGVGGYNQRRLLSAQALDMWLNTEPTGVVCPYKAIAGDLNAYALEDPIVFLTEEAGYVNVESPLDYSYLFDGQVGTLDYILVNKPLYSRVTGSGVWHINEDEFDYLDYNLDFGKEASVFNGTIPARSSDHSPVLVGLDMSESGGIGVCEEGGKGKGKGGKCEKEPKRRTRFNRKVFKGEPDNIDVSECQKQEYYPGVQYDCIGTDGAGLAVLDLKESLIGATVAGTGRGPLTGTAYCCKKKDCKFVTENCFPAPYTFVGESSPCDYTNGGTLSVTPSYPHIPAGTPSPGGICNGVERPEDFEYAGPLWEVATSYDELCRLTVFCCVPAEECEV